MKTYAPTQNHTPGFTTALIIIVQKWKQPQCPSTDEWINKRYPYDGILFSHKKEVTYNMNEP